MQVTPTQKIITRCKEIFAKAKELYGVDLSVVTVSFDLRGRPAGMASRKAGRYYMKFNRDMLTREAFDHVYNDTVPHEIAHIVCYMKPELGANHDAGWARVCRALGGSGARTHNEDVVYGKGYTYEYVTDRGHKVRIGDRHHAGVQSGGTLRFRAGKGNVTQHCAYSIVGHQGRTLETPIVKKPVVTAPAARIPVHIPQAVYATPPAQAPKPVTAAPVPVTYTRPAATESKAATARRIMLAGKAAGQSYEDIISAIMMATGHDRQLARATYKANAAKVGIAL